MPDGTDTMDREETTLDPEMVKRLPDEKTRAMLERYEMELDRKDRDPKNTPPEAQFVFREKKDWTEVGWTEAHKQEVKDRLASILEIKPQEALENALEIIAGDAIANNKTPQDVLDRLTAQNYQKFRNDVAREVQSSPNHRGYEERDIKLLFLGSEREIESVDENGEPHGEKEIVGLKLSQDYIKRFVLSEEFHKELREEAYQQIPENIYETAWQIAFNQEGKFGIHGDFPMLQMQIEQIKDPDNPDKMKTVARYRINQANFVRWIRYWIMYEYEKDPDEVKNYFAEIKIPNKHQYSQVTIGGMMDSAATYFKDEDGHDYGDLWDQTLLEPWMMMTIREYDIKYKFGMASEENLAKTINELFFYNKLTKKTYEKSMMYYMTTLGLDFKGKDTDATMGSAWTTMFLAYYNLSDFEKLQEILGKDSSFFTREGMEKAMKKVAQKKYSQTETKSLTLGSFMGSDVMANFEKAFGEDGKLKDAESFSKFVNHFAVKRSNGNWVDVIKTALTNTVEETHDFNTQQSNATFDENGNKKYKLDESSLNMAHLIAYSWQRWTGAAARNDTGVAGYDSATKWYYTELYRRKMATPERAGSFGNPYTVPMFKGTMVDFMRGTRVAEAETKGLYADSKNRRKTPLEVFEDMHKSMADIRAMKTELDALNHQDASDEVKAQKHAEIDAAKKASDAKFKEAAGQLEFTDNTMRNYAGDHVDRTHKIYSLIMKADEVNFDKFTKYDLFRGLTFDRAAFQEEIQDKFLKPLRYLWETNGDMNFNMPVRYPVFLGRDKNNKDKVEYREMPLGEALFGYEMLNIPEFRMKASDLVNLTPEQIEAGGLRRKGKYVVNQDGRYEINFDRVQDQQTLMWKQWALMKFGGDLWTHLDRHSTDPAYGIQHYYNVLGAIASIPGEVFGDDDKMRNVKINMPFFDKKQMKWLREISGTSTFRLLMKGIFDDLGSKTDEPGFSRSASLFVGAIFRGY